MKILKTIGETMIEGDVEALQKLVDQALAQGIDQHTIINDGLIAAMMDLGELFKRDEVFIPEVLIAAMAMKAVINKLGFENVSDTCEPKGTIVIGTVHNDMHDIGKNLVALMLKSGGFLVHDLGVDISSEEFVEAARRYKPDIIALSALLTTTMPEMEAVIEALKREGLRSVTRILVGGAPVTEDFALSIGADGFASDATSSVKTALELMND